MTETETKTEQEALFKIESIDDIKRILTIAKGGDPDAIQALSNFMNLKSSEERSYFPDKTTTIGIAQLNGLGRTYFPNDDWDPFSLCAECIAVSYMGYKGFKSNQFVDMTRQAPNLDALKTSSDEVKQGLVARILGRSNQGGD